VTNKTRALQNFLEIEGIIEYVTVERARSSDLAKCCVIRDERERERERKR
jgi:hypothetical protein